MSGGKIGGSGGQCESMKGRGGSPLSGVRPFPVAARRPLEVKCAESGRIRKQFSSMTVIMRAHDERGIPARP